MSTAENTASEISIHPLLDVERYLDRRHEVTSFLTGHDLPDACEREGLTRVTEQLERPPETELLRKAEGGTLEGGTLTGTDHTVRHEVASFLTGLDPPDALEREDLTRVTEQLKRPPEAELLRKAEGGTLTGADHTVRLASLLSEEVGLEDGGGKGGEYGGKTPTRNGGTGADCRTIQPKTPAAIREVNNDTWARRLAKHEDGIQGIRDSAAHRLNQGIDRAMRPATPDPHDRNVTTYDWLSRGLALRRLEPVSLRIDTTDGGLEHQILDGVGAMRGYPFPDSGRVTEGTQAPNKDEAEKPYKPEEQAAELLPSLQAPLHTDLANRLERQRLPDRLETLISWIDQTCEREVALSELSTSRPQPTAEAIDHLLAGRSDIELEEIIGQHHSAFHREHAISALYQLGLRRRGSSQNCRAMSLVKAIIDRITALVLQELSIEELHLSLWSLAMLEDGMRGTYQFALNLCKIVEARVQEFSLSQAAGILDALSRLLRDSEGENAVIRIIAAFTERAETTLLPSGEVNAISGVPWTDFLMGVVSPTRGR